MHSTIKSTNINGMKSKTYSKIVKAKGFDIITFRSVGFFMPNTIAGLSSGGVVIRATERYTVVESVYAIKVDTFNKLIAGFIISNKKA